MMNKLSLVALLAFSVMAVSAQDNPYIVKTNGVKKTVQKSFSDSALESEEDNVPRDFLAKNFRYYSMCDWEEGTRFMVIPEKYDQLVSTFHDTVTGDEVSSTSLRHHIMVYKGYENMINGRVHIHFYCETNNMNYYYELPIGTYNDYCYSRKGVPTLAFLGDVDKARELLVGQQMLTRSQIYREDTEYDDDGYREITIPKNQLVKVVAVGVGTRAFPVKIIVQDENGRQFYQNVAMSKTNCGMRDSDFEEDNARFYFPGSFEYTGGDMDIYKNINDYLNQTIHTKFVTTMNSRGSGKVREVKVPSFTGFIVDDIRPLKTNGYYVLMLRESETRRIYSKEITFNEAIALANGSRDDYFGSLFGLGDGESRATTLETRTAIREGRVIPGMTEEEVELAVGEPVTRVRDSEGVMEWLYNRSNGVLLVVRFNDDGIVTKAGGRATKAASGATQNTRRTASMSNSSRRLTGSGIAVQ